MRCRRARQPDIRPSLSSLRSLRDRRRDSDLLIGATGCRDAERASIGLFPIELDDRRVGEGDGEPDAVWIALERCHLPIVKRFLQILLEPRGNGFLPSGHHVLFVTERVKEVIVLHEPTLFWLSGHILLQGLTLGDSLPPTDPHSGMRSTPGRDCFPVGRYGRSGRRAYCVAPSNSSVRLASTRERAPLGRRPDMVELYEDVRFSVRDAIAWTYRSLAYRSERRWSRWPSQIRRVIRRYS